MHTSKSGPARQRSRNAWHLVTHKPSLSCTILEASESPSSTLLLPSTVDELGASTVIGGTWRWCRLTRGGLRLWRCTDSIAAPDGARPLASLTRVMGSVSGTKDEGTADAGRVDIKDATTVALLSTRCAARRPMALDGRCRRSPATALLPPPAACWKGADIGRLRPLRRAARRPDDGRGSCCGGGNAHGVGTVAGVG